MKKSISILALVMSAVSAVGLAGCGTSTTPTTSDTSSGASAAPVTLQLYWWGADDRIQRTQKVIAGFEQKYPNITVNPVYTDWTGYWDKLSTMTAAGTMPDVVQMDQLYIASYAQRGTLADLSQNSQLDTTTEDPSILGVGQIDGKLYGMPISTTALGLVVNTDLLKQYGIALPNDSTWTWNDYMAWAKSVTDASGGKVYGTDIAAAQEFILQLYARQMGDQLFSNGDIAIKQDTLTAYFQQCLDLVQSGATPSASAISEAINQPLAQSNLATGLVAASFSPATQITAYAAAMNGANLKLLQMPSIAGSSKWEYLKPGMYWSMSSKSQHPQEAAELINYLVNDPDAGAILGTERGIPASSSILSAITPNLSATEQQTVSFTQSLTLGAAPSIIPNGASDIQNIVIRYALQVISGTQSPADAAKAMIDEVHGDIQSAS